MYSVKYFVLFSSISLSFFIANSQRKEVEQASFSLSFFIANSQRKEVEQASFSSDFDTADLTADERRIIKEWKPFQDPIRLVRERLQKKPRFSFRSANNARPILDQQDNEESVVQVETQTPNPNTDESEAPCASGSCKNSQEQMERKRVEWLKKTVLEEFLSVGVRLSVGVHLSVGVRLSEGVHLNSGKKVFQFWCRAFFFGLHLNLGKKVFQFWSRPFFLVFA